MQVKKAAYDAVLKKLESELDSVQYKIRRNKDSFKELVMEQSTLKRERGILSELIRGVKGETKSDV